VLGCDDGEWDTTNLSAAAFGGRRSAKRSNEDAAEAGSISLLSAGDDDSWTRGKS